MTLPSNELDIAKGIRDGSIQSPTHMQTYSMFAMRITGTGCSFRTARGEYVWRDPSLYLNDTFLERCNGLLVIWEHPEDKTDENPHAMVDSKEFHDRIVGTVFVPYLKEDEVWGICKIYDRDAITLLSHNKMSTSPGVVFSQGNGNRKIEIDEGNMLLIEGEAQILDHLAICEQGVWDKIDEPSGIASNTTGENSMTEAEKAAQEEKDAQAKKDAQARKDAENNEMPAWAADSFGRMMERLDSMKSEFDAFRKDSAGSEDDKKAAAQAAADKARADAETKAAMDAQAEKDAAKARLDAVEEAVKKAMPAERSDEEAKECADAQAECDSVAMAFGKQARHALPGESSTAFRRRLASEYQAHSPRWKDSNLASLDGVALKNAVQDIYKDAQVAARAPNSVPAGVLREIRSESAAGHKISEFVGDQNSWMDNFKPPMRERVMKGDLRAPKNFFESHSAQGGIN